MKINKATAGLTAVSIFCPLHHISMVSFSGDGRVYKWWISRLQDEC